MESLVHLNGWRGYKLIAQQDKNKKKFEFVSHSLVTLKQKTSSIYLSIYISINVYVYVRICMYMYVYAIYETSVVYRFQHLYSLQC